MTVQNVSAQGTEGNTFPFLRMEADIQKALSVVSPGEGFLKLRLRPIEAQQIEECLERALSFLQEHQNSFNAQAGGAA